ncbi:hypothetical protein F4801DRAFT_220310 [Xylaria longipes]|nr:hypothetical protein F4801DRAFT_220310 [Xylaria longipes]
MTISLSSGLEVRIPINQYLVLFVEVDGSGSHVFNTLRRKLLLSDVTGNPNKLGHYFPTGAFIMVNHDTGAFTMWAANPTREGSLVSFVSTDAEATVTILPSLPRHHHLTQAKQQLYQPVTKSASGLDL